MGLAAALSLAAAIALDRWKISEDGFEGLLLLLAAVFVVTMIVWMNRMARHLRKEIERRVDSFAGKSDLAAGWGLGTFVFLMVLREGAELALILRAVELSSEGVAVWIGTGAGTRCGDCRRRIFLSGHTQNSARPFFCGDQCDSDHRRGATRADRRARIQRSHVASLGQARNGAGGPDRAQ